jgi:capsular polysaccharide transport system permease protein
MTQSTTSDPRPAPALKAIETSPRPPAPVQPAPAQPAPVQVAPAAGPAASPAPKPAPKPAPGPAAKPAAAPPAPPGAAPPTPKPAPGPAPMAAAQTVAQARPRARHWGVLASFALLVLLPFLASTAYLYLRAADQYHSTTAFSIRSEEMGSAAAGILGAITQIGSGSASDTDILYNFIRSQRIVAEIDAELDLRRIYNAAEGDPVFTLGDDASIEDLVRHWERMVTVDFSGEGIIEVRANAFRPEDAQAISQAILAQSGMLVNRLSVQAREDAVRFAREEAEEAEAALRTVRQSLAEFRREHRLVDPSADVAGQMGLLNALQGELAQALVERDMLLSFVGDSDQRVVQANRRINAVTARIEEERASLGVAGADGGALPEIVGRYEELLVDLEFANTAYTQTLAGLAAARAEARRQSRYLAPHVEPTLAQSALYPRRAMLAGLIGLFLVLGWGLLMLVYYNVRDNR